jgi:hypothetical protein
MSKSDEVRHYVFQKYVLPARKQGWPVITVKGGEVARAMGLTKRVPLVCDAIGARRFQREFGISLLKRTGPAQGTAATFSFSI